MNYLLLGRLFGCSVFLSFVFIACQRNIDTLDSISLDYYPLEEGKYKIYQIDSTVYDDFNCTVINVSFQLKEVVARTIVDGENDLTYVLERYKRQDATQPWVLKNVWTEKIEANQLQRVEDNQRFVKMIFPVQEGKEWDGISYINKDTLFAIRGGAIAIYKDWGSFSYQAVESTFIDVNQSPSKVYPNTVKVLHVDKENAFEKRFSKEIYAKNIGAVYKEMCIVDTQCDCLNVSDSTCVTLPWSDKIDKGYILRQSLIEHNY